MSVNNPGRVPGKRRTPGSGFGQDFRLGKGMNLRRKGGARYYEKTCFFGIQLRIAATK